MIRNSLLLAILTLNAVVSLDAKPPTAPTPGVRALDLYADGKRAHLLTAEIVDDGPAHLLHRVSADGGETWSKARRVDAGMPSAFSPHHGFDPQIAANGQRLVAAWTTAGTDRWGSGPIATALSEDGGATWRPGPNPADDGLTTGHGFLDLAVDAGGAFHLVWLDSRDGKQGLRHASSLDGGTTWSANRTLKAGTCECCRNTLAIDPDGHPAVLFRDHDPRDMKVVFTKKGEWQPPLVAGDFGWKFEGCPHVGGGLAATRSGLHALVWTGSEADPGIHHVRPGAESRRLGGSGAIHPDLAADAEGTLLAVWQERTEEGSVLHHTLSNDEGVTWSEPRPLSQAGLSATHPRVVSAGPARFLVVWTETPEGSHSRWRSVRVPAP